MTKEESISEVDSVIRRLLTLIEDLNDLKKDFVDFDGEYFPEQLNISEPDNIKILGFSGVVGTSDSSVQGLHVLFWKQWFLYSKFFHVEKDELKNVKRTKLIDKILG